MKQASPLTQSLLASTQLLYADLYTITLIVADPGASTGGYGGYGYGPPAPVQLFYTDADQKLIYNSNTYLCTRPAVSRTGTKCSSDMSVDTVDVSIFGSDADLVNGSVPFPQFALNGGFDGATVSIDRCFMPTYGDTSAGVVNIFFGNVSEVKPSRSALVLTVSSQLELLNLDMPRNLLMPGCIHNLFDAGCTLYQTSYQAYDSVSSATTGVINSTGLNMPSGYFTNGTIMFTSGANTGVTTMVKQHTLVNGINTFTLTAPLNVAPGVGDNFAAFPGCDKTMATCANTFNNLANFRGWPFVPAPTASM